MGKPSPSGRDGLEKLQSVRDSLGKLSPSGRDSLENSTVWEEQSGKTVTVGKKTEIGQGILYNVCCSKSMLV